MMIAWGALILWPVVALILYKQHSLAVATTITILGGYLFLPVGLGLDLPKLPTLDRNSITVLAAIVLTAVTVRIAFDPVSARYRGALREKPDVLPGWIPRGFVVRLLLLLLFGGIVATTLTNRDALTYGYRFLPGHTLYDAGAMLMEIALVFAPLLLGRKVLSSGDAQTVLLKLLVLFALGYSLLALWEVRMSPQLHLQIYGYFPSSFAQQMRASGFRPVVFLGHGLAVSLFFALATLAAAGLFRASAGPDRWKWLAAAGWLFVVLVLSKSLGAVMITVVLLPVVLFLSARMQVVAAVCIAGAFLSYPVLRSADLVPIQEVLNFANEIGETRAGSFALRVENEDRLLAKAMERPLFGWGGWGRPRVYTETGFNITIADGSWIIELGTGGWVRYIGMFGLLCWPVFGLFLARRDKVDHVSACLAILICAKLVDLIPNSVIGPVTLLMAGSLIGRLERRQAATQVSEDRSLPGGAGTAPDRPRYARRLDKPPVAARTAGPAETAQDAPRRPPYRRPQVTGGHRR